MTDRLPRSRVLAAGLLAGLVAGTSIVACIALSDGMLFAVPGFSLAGLFAFDAAALVGKAAYAGGAYAFLGVGVHFTVAIGWALGYAVVAQRQAELVRRPIASGAGFGIVVYFAMQLVLVMGNLYHTPGARELGVALFAHLARFGIPVALVIARQARAA